jgi:hypothetical protein
MYYLRTRPKADAIQFTVDQTALAQTRKADATSKAAASKAQSEDVGVSKATKGLEFEPEIQCESCSA